MTSKAIGLLANFERRVSRFAGVCVRPMARISLFIVFFWFGILKIVADSPANPLVERLLERTMPFIGFDQFIIFLGLFEMALGILFLIPRLERIAVVVLGLHMFTTFMPLALLPDLTWQAPFVPTLEGQYIVKNLVIIALALGIAAELDHADS